MKNKYYMPNVEEFHMGFEYEYYYNIEWHTESFSLNSPVLVDDVLLKLKNGEIRVKYLDKENIESLGFRFDAWGNFTKEDVKILFYGFDYIGDNNGFQYNGEMYISKYKTKDGQLYDDQYSIFNGIIKNKSELKKLLIQLGINEQSTK